MNYLLNESMLKIQIVFICVAKTNNSSKCNSNLINVADVIAYFASYVAEKFSNES